MAEYLTTDTDLQSVANAIRAKGKTTAQLAWPSGYNTAINAINAVDLCVSSSDSASMVTVDDAANMNAKNVVVNIEPVQSGSGDPSPTNVRPITGWTGTHIYVSPTQDAQDGTTYNVQFPTEAGTVYGGTLTIDANGTGELVVDRAEVDLGTLTWTSLLNNADWNCFSTVISTKANGGNNFICSNYPFATIYKTEADGVICGNVSNKNFYIRDSRYTDIAAFKAAMSGVQLVYELASPATYTLTAEQISLLSGTNNVWADCGDIALTYYTEDFADLADEIGFAEGGDY